MSDLGVRTAARKEAERIFIPRDRPTSTLDQVAVQSFVDGAVWAAGRLPARDEIANTIRDRPLGQSATGAVLALIQDRMTT